MGFIHLPDENELRQTTSYHKIFALTLFWNVGLLGIIFVFFFIISFVLKTYQLKTKRNLKNALRQSLMSEESKQQTQQRLSERQPQVIDTQTAVQDVPLFENPTTKRFKVCNFLTSFFFYLFWVDVALVYLVFYIFGYMGRGVSHDILAVFIMVLIVVIPTLVWKNSTKIKEFRLIKKELIFTVISLLLWTGVAVFSVIALKGACLCYYNDNYGFSVGGQSGPFMSTEWTRTNVIQKQCKDGQICNIYATVPLNTSSEVFINMHTGMDIQNLTVRLINSLENTTYEKNITYYSRLQNVEDIGKRIVHTAYFKNLKPDTTYQVQVLKTPFMKDPYTAPLIKTAYKTTPDKDTNVLRMAVGGDVSMTHEGLKITHNLVSYNPDIVIIGGDNTYDDGMRTCWYSWDNFYGLFDDLNKNLGRLVPIIMSVGNHDVGFDSMAAVDISYSEEEIPLYFMYNPQHLNASGKVPSIADRQTNHTHIIGPTVHLHLDSGYILPFQKQSEQIQQVGEKYKGYYLFANYHNPIYPSCTDYNDGSNDINVIEKGTKYWVPHFDQYNFTACFEHHTHHKKFTNKMKNGTVSKDGTGTRYVGDGSWGVVEGSCPAEKVTRAQSNFEFFDQYDPNHIWLVTYSKTNQANQTVVSLNYTAIDINGSVKNNQTRTDILTPFA